MKENVKDPFYASHKNDASVLELNPITSILSASIFDISLFWPISPRLLEVT